MKIVTKSGLILFFLMLFTMICAANGEAPIASALVKKSVIAVPASVKAVTFTYHGIDISWKAVNGASGYEVYRAVSNSKVAFILVSSGTNAIYRNSGLITNKTYYYKVRAYRLTGGKKNYSNFSAVVSAKPVLDAPKNIIAARIDSTSIRLSWNQAAGASGYEVLRATSNTGKFSMLAETVKMNYLNTSLAKDKAYYYKIRSYRAVGTTKVYSEWSRIQSISNATIINTIGNSWANLNNGGIAASQGDWIYYRSGINMGLIYKMRFDGSKKTLVYKGRSASGISVIGKTIYYTQSPSKNVFGLDGGAVALCYEGDSNFYLLSDSNYHYVYATSNTRYYCGNNFAVDGNGFTAGKRLFNGDRYYIGIGDWIYYLKPDIYGGTLYKNKPSGDSETLVLNSEISKFDIYNNYIYFISAEDKKLYKASIDGSDISLFLEEKVDYINIQDGWIYYSNQDDGNKLYKIKIDGSCKTKLNNEESSYINIISDWIFYVSGNNCIRIKNDGTNRQLL